jgi:AcrR family transcriptional regulator
LWFAAVDHGFAALAGALAETLVEAEDDDDLAQLRALVVRFIEVNAVRPALLRIITQEATTPGPRLDHLFNRYIDPVREFGSDLLARLAATGQVRTDSVSLLYFLMTHGAGGPLALPGLAERFGDAIDPSDPDAVHRHAVEATAVIFDGLVAAPDAYILTTVTGPANLAGDGPPPEDPRPGGSSRWSPRRAGRLWRTGRRSGPGRRPRQHVVGDQR